MLLNSTRLLVKLTLSKKYVGNDEKTRRTAFFQVVASGGKEAYDTAQTNMLKAIRMKGKNTQ